MIQLIKSTIPVQFLLSFLFLMTSNVSGQVFINEILPDPVGSDDGNEWVELYNASGSAVPLDGYVLKDKYDRQLILSGSIDKWLVVYQKGSFALTNTGSTIKLYDSTVSGNLINEFSYFGSAEGKSWGRIPDGGEIFVSVLDPTPGGPNQTPTPSPTSTPKNSPTASAAPTPSKTPSPTPSPTKTPTLAPTKTPIPKPTLEVVPTAESLVLGLRNQLMTSEPSATPESQRKEFSILPILLIVAGAGFMGVAGLLFFKKAKTDYTDTTGETHENN